MGHRAQPRTPTPLRTTTVAAAIAVLVAAGLECSGGYYALAAGILGGSVAIAATALLTLGLAPSRPATFAAATLGALGLWSIVSTTWGGLPHVSWRFAGLMLAAASALIAGSALGGHARAVAGGVLAGVTVHAVVVLATVGSGSAPPDWFRSRQLQGPIGYHNGEATICAMGVPLALWAATSHRRSVRGAGGAIAVLFLSVTLLTQSRGSIAAIAIAVLLQLALARRVRLAVLAALLLAASVPLFLSLRTVDRALIDGRSIDHAASRYVLLALLLALAVGAMSLVSPPPLRLTPRKAYLMAGAGAATVIATVAIGIAILAPRLVDVRAQLTAEASGRQAAAGDTRLANFSTSGRIELWRVALKMGMERPATGYGAGSFTQRWTIDRTNKDAYVLQPHSLELEVFAELGFAGLILIVAALGGVTLCVARGIRAHRAVAAATAGSLGVFLLVASVDWTYSFVGLAIPAMLLAGAAAGPGASRFPTRPRAIGYMVALLGVLGVLAGPALAQHQLGRARSQADTSPAAAWLTAASARSWDRWDPAVVEFQGVLAERDGRLRDAAALYRRAATLSTQPWALSYREAQTLQHAGLLTQSRAACRRAIAANPLEPDLWGGVCENTG